MIFGRSPLVWILCGRLGEALQMLEFAYVECSKSHLCVVDVVLQFSAKIEREGPPIQDASIKHEPKCRTIQR